MEDGLALLPGNNIAKLIKVWEEKLRADPAIQMEDSSLCLVGSDVAFFRMAVGTCLYITRDRPDIAFTVKELSSYMSSVSDAASQETCFLFEGNQSLCSCAPTTSWRTRLAQTDQ